ncbi:MAG: CarD family transcriptional regulator [Alphaproteobacteria bacterium]|nr:CarD family transcriptional regulator [Alphaproteobacteria bacterium]
MASKSKKSKPSGKPAAKAKGKSKPKAKTAAVKKATPAKPALAPKKLPPKPAQPQPVGPVKPGMIRPGQPMRPGMRPELIRQPSKQVNFKVEEYVVYPTHGVGRVTGIENLLVGGEKHTLYVVLFDKEKMTLRIPIGKVSETGMRRLSTPKEMNAAIAALKGRSRIRRTMWSRRAQEYDAKINSGDPIAIAEVVRDLHRNVGQPEQSYSERQLYEAALARMARELAAVEKIDEETATEKLEAVLKAA